jgi:hypothetical protein
MPSGSNLTFESRMGFPSDLPNVVVGLQAAISRFVAEANDDANGAIQTLKSAGSADISLQTASYGGYQALDSDH